MWATNEPGLRRGAPQDVRDSLAAQYFVDAIRDEDTSTQQAENHTETGEQWNGIQKIPTQNLQCDITDPAFSAWIFYKIYFMMDLEKDEIRTGRKFLFFSQCRGFSYALYWLRKPYIPARSNVLSRSRASGIQIRRNGLS
ncbi:hypothetical protein AVEN_95247-1 [Araneus ventricosus]|uniref:Uncharacterized protein n=1 Tax=Araneus ventricosus TaxID=182803 RepID=A0A4Y2DG03_ARAVE|nr:hypothetical protein AVEN_95247-1 [Araneus ventricosus]